MRDVRQSAGTRIIGTNDAGDYSCGAVIKVLLDGHGERTRDVRKAFPGRIAAIAVDGE